MPPACVNPDAEPPDGRPLHARARHRPPALPRHRAGRSAGAARRAVLLPVERQLEEASLDVDRKSTRLNSSHSQISYAVFCLKKKNSRHRVNSATPLLRSYLPVRQPLLTWCASSPRSIGSEPGTLQSSVAL